jgi:hypothetical protein
MPLPIWVGRNAASFDKFLELRAFGAVAGAETGTAIQIAVRKSLDYRVVINSRGYTGFVAGTAFYTVIIEVSATAGGTYTEVARLNLAPTAGLTEIPLSGSQVNYVVPTAEFIRHRVVITGTPAGLNFAAYLEGIH